MNKKPRIKNIFKRRFGKRERLNRELFYKLLNLLFDKSEEIPDDLSWKHKVSKREK